MLSNLKTFALLGIDAIAFATNRSAGIVEIGGQSRNRIAAGRSACKSRPGNLGQNRQSCEQIGRAHV